MLESKIKIVVMDDDEDVLQYMRILLQGKFSSVMFSNSTEGTLEIVKEIASENKDNLIAVLDLEMHRNRNAGEEVAKQLLAICPELRIIAHSAAHKQSRVMENPQEHGFLAVIDKFPSREQFWAAIKLALEGPAIAA